MAKITIEIDGELLCRAKRLGRETGRPLRAVVEDSLHAVLLAKEQMLPYRLPDLSVGSECSPDPLENYSWQELRAIIYGDDEPR